MYRYRSAFKDSGGSRDTSETDSRNSRTNQEPTSKRQKNKRQLPKGSKDINPTSPPTDPHAHPDAHAPNCTRHRPHANPGTHASPQYKHEPPPDKFRSSTLHPSFHRSTPLSGLAAVLAAVESVAGFVRVCVVGFGWMVVRFVRVIRAVFVRVCVRLGLGGWL